MADAVAAALKDVEQETVDELVGMKSHDLLAVFAAATIVVIAEGNAFTVVARQVAKSSLSPSPRSSRSSQLLIRNVAKPPFRYW